MNMSITNNRSVTRSVAQALPRLANYCVRVLWSGQETKRDHELYQPIGFIGMT